MPLPFETVAVKVDVPPVQIVDAEVAMDTEGSAMTVIVVVAKGNSQPIDVFVILILKSVETVKTGVV